MKHAITLAALVAAISLVSCAGDDVVQSASPGATRRESVTLRAVQGGTRAALDVLGDKTPKWEAGDKLGVRYDIAPYTAGNDLTLSAGEGTASGTFTGQIIVPQSKTNMEFFYPAATAAGEYDLTVQNAATPGKYIVMYAQTTASATPTATMQNKTAVLKFDLTLPSAVNNINSAIVKGCYSKGTLEYDGHWTATSYNDITLTGVTIGGVASNHISGSCVVLPGVTDGNMSLEIEVDGKTYTSAASSSTSNLQSGKIYNVSKFTSIEWVPIKGGRQLINNQATKISDFEISATEITNAQWVAFLNEVDPDGDKMPDAEIDDECPVNQALCGQSQQYSYSYDTEAWSVASGKEDFPAAYVTWYGAKSFATYYGVKLMTECQFEYAAHKVEISDGFQLNDYAWKKENSGNAAHAVGTKTGAAIGKNGEQVYDLLGNLWEWCQDWYDSSNYPSGTTDPTGPTSGSNRVYRGGSWNNNASDATSSDRSHELP